MDRTPDPTNPGRTLSVIERLRARLSYANVIATIALFVALGGTGYAVTTLPRNSVGPKQLRSHAVTASKIKPGAITSLRVRDHSLTGVDINAGTLGKVPAAASADHAASADQATSAATATSLGGVTATELRVHCPSGTVLYQGACMETAQRAAAGWSTANENCAFDGRRLPTAGELQKFKRVTGITFSASEWTGDAVDGSDFVISDELGGLSTQPGSASLPYRCVAALTN
jgi:hypothetical protein